MQDFQKNNKSNLNKNKLKSNQNQDYYEDEFQSQKKIETHEQKVTLPKLQKKSKKAKQNVKDQQEDYENDFEGTQKNIEPSLKNSKIEEKKKQPKSNKTQVKTDKSNQKLNNANNTNNESRQARNSLHAQQVQKQSQNYSKSSQKTKQNLSSYNGFSKYSTSFQKQFPYQKEQLLTFNQQKINRLNQKLRNYISKVNTQLTDLINVNMMKLKIKKVQRSPDIEKDISVLNQQKKSNLIVLDTTQKQVKNMLEKCQKFSEEEYELMIYHEMTQIKSTIKELTKEIVDMQKSVKVDGNKLIQQNHNAEKINEVKNQTVKAKKEEERNQLKITKLDLTFEELTHKNAQVDKILAKVLEQAKTNNVKLNLGNDIKKQEKLNQLSKKVQNLKSHQHKVKAVTSKKTQISAYDNEILNNSIKESMQRFEQCKAEISNIQERSMQMIVEAKNKKNLAAHIQAHLDFVYRMMEEGTVMQNTSYLQSKNRQTNSKMIKKHGSVANVNKLVNGRSQSQNQNLTKTKFLISKKPQLLIKKQKQHENINADHIQIEAQKRVWKEAEQSKHAHEQKIEKKQAPKKEEPIVAVQTKSKPFSIKKKDKEESKPQPKEQKNIQQKQNHMQKSEKASLGPKMMKFNKQKKEETVQNPIIRQQSPNQEKIQLKNHKNPDISIEQKVHNDNLDRRESINNGKPKMRIKKASKQKIQIPSGDLYMFPPDKKVDNVKYIQTQSDISKSAKKHENTQKPAQQAKQQEINFGNRRAQQRKIQKKVEQTYI